jgi:proteasome lid subunit RPN8/RPN11
MATSTKRRLADGERVNPVIPVHVWQTPVTSDTRLVVVTHLEVYAAIHAGTTASLPHETGGFLLGRVSCDAQGPCWLVEIDETMPVEPVEQDSVHFSFSWRDVDRVRRYREERQKALLGWYHSHPDVGVFLSETDVEHTHRLLFAEPFQVALVFDPVRGRAGYFFWERTQVIDTAQASWREFVIAAAPEEPPEATSRDASTAADAPPEPPASSSGAASPVGAWPPLQDATPTPMPPVMEHAVAGAVPRPDAQGAPPVDLAAGAVPGRTGGRREGVLGGLALPLLLLGIVTVGVVLLFVALFTAGGR